MARTEVQIGIQTNDGPKTVTLLSDITVDDLVRVGLKTYVREMRFGTEYTSPFSREIRIALTRVRVAQRA